MLKFDQGFHIKLNAWTYRKLVRSAAVSIVLGLQVHTNSGIQFEMRVNFRQKLDLLCASSQASETNEKCPSPKCLVSWSHLSRHRSADIKWSPELFMDP